jgi:putative ABC transport system permease protein
MTAFKVLLQRFRALFTSSRDEHDLDFELHSHIEALTQANIHRGMSLAEAREAARREFGGLEQTKETYRDQRSLPFLDALLQDLRFALRMLGKKPAFTTVAILTLAVGIGASSAVFSVVDRILFRSLPYPEDDRLVSFGDIAPFDSREFLLGPDFVDWRARQAAFESITAVEPGSIDCDLTEQNPARLNCGQADAAFLPTFRITPLLGRNFSRDEDRPYGPRVVLLSYGLWRSRFASDPAIVGKNISLDAKPAQIIGVLPETFELPTLARADLLLPLALDESTGRGPNDRQRILRTFARLKPGISESQALASLTPLFQDSLNFVPPQFRKEVSLRVRSLRDRQVGDSKAASWILLAAVLSVLLVACTNVANLILARATGRHRELAVRAALGATRGRLIRQALTESVLLGFLGGAAGCIVAYSLLRLFLSIAPEGIPRLQQATLDFRVLLFTLGVSLLAGILFGLAPASRHPEPDVLVGKESRVTVRNFLRQALVTAQIAVSLFLLAGAGLLLRSLWNLQGVPLGIDTQTVLTVQIDLAEYRYPQPPQQLQFFRELQARLAHLPGVSALGLSDTLPPSGGMQATFLSSLQVPGQPKFAQGTGGMIGYRYVTPGYFPALGIHILSGRAFEPADLASADNPVILNETLAKRLMLTGDPVGRKIFFDNHHLTRTVVGIAADVKNNGLTAAADPEFYLPWKEAPDGYFRTGHFILRTPMNPQSVVPWLRSEVAAVDPTTPLKIETLRQRISKLADRPRFNAILLSIFAAMAVLLAAIGLYGVVGFLVAQQTREIGVRMALGATPRGILTMVLSAVVRWTISGALLGLLGAWLSARLLESLLFQVRVHDPALLLLTLGILLVVAFLAAFIPARRAMHVDPMVALRYE